jgi:hypothetical protein
MTPHTQRLLAAGGRGAPPRMVSTGSMLFRAAISGTSSISATGAT